MLQFLLPEELEVFPVMDYDLVCQAIGKYPFTRYKSTRFAELGAYPLLVPVTNNDLNASLYFLIKHFTHREDILLEYSIPVYRTMIRSGRGVGFSIKHCYADQISTYINDVASVVIEEDVKIQLLCIYTGTAPLPPQVQFFLDHLRAHIQL